MTALSSDELAEIIERAREYVRCIDDAPGEEYETLADDFAEALVQIVGACVIGVPCADHDGAVHGQEAEELRKGIEQALATTGADGDHPRENLRELRLELQRLLDAVCARDSLAFLEAADVAAASTPPPSTASNLVEDWKSFVCQPPPEPQNLSKVPEKASDAQLQAIASGETGSQASTEMICRLAEELLAARQARRQDAAKLCEVISFLLRAEACARGIRDGSAP